MEITKTVQCMRFSPDHIVIQTNKFDVDFLYNCEIIMYKKEITKFTYTKNQYLKIEDYHLNSDTGLLHQLSPNILKLIQSWKTYYWIKEMTLSDISKFMDGFK